MLAERFEWGQDGRESKAHPVRFRGPVRHHHAVWGIDHTKSPHRSRRSLTQRRQGWNHSIEERKSQRHAESVEYGAARHRLSCHEYDLNPPWAGGEIAQR